MKKNHFYSLVLFGAVTGWLWLAMLAQTLMSVSTWGDLPVTLLLCVLTGGGAALLFNAAWMKVSSRFFGAHENVPEYEPTPFAGKVSLTAVVIVSLLGAAQGYSYSKKTLEEARLKQAYEQKRQRDSVVKAEAEKRKSDAEDALQRSRHAAEVEELKHGLANLTALQFGSRSWQTEARQLARRIEALPDFSAKTALVAEHTRQVEPFLAARAAAADQVVGRCLAQNDCAYHLIGIATSQPYLQMSVMEKVAKTWTDVDWDAAVEATRKTAAWARDNPREALHKYDGIPPTAPFFNQAATNVTRGLATVSVGSVAERKKREPRTGVPGWLTIKAPERDRVPIGNVRLQGGAPSQTSSIMPDALPTEPGALELSSRIEDLRRLTQGSSAWLQKIAVIGEAMKALPESEEKVNLRKQLDKQVGAYIKTFAQQSATELAKASSALWAQKMNETLSEMRLRAAVHQRGGRIVAEVRGPHLSEQLADTLGNEGAMFESAGKSGVNELNFVNTRTGEEWGLVLDGYLDPAATVAGGLRKQWGLE